PGAGGGGGSATHRRSPRRSRRHLAPQVRMPRGNLVVGATPRRLRTLADRPGPPPGGIRVVVRVVRDPRARLEEMAGSLLPPRRLRRRPLRRRARRPRPLPPVAAVAVPPPA